MARPYEAPALTTLGSLADLTLETPKDFGVTSDGDFLAGKPLYTVSCDCSAGTL
ncbi:lasso RiPP family leader peptide-containing protein [Kineococcus sp. G2]|uniref:lasso RiPP family leader peptide-containing protein n=1 Tax=Kineococcus sp. G2 TaxID=3127484 RepID=UPI00301CDE47